MTLETHSTSSTPSFRAKRALETSSDPHTNCCAVAHDFRRSPSCSTILHKSITGAFIRYCVLSVATAAGCFDAKRWKSDSEAPCSSHRRIYNDGRQLVGISHQHKRAALKQAATAWSWWTCAASSTNTTSNGAAASNTPSLAQHKHVAPTTRAAPSCALIDPTVSPCTTRSRNDGATRLEEDEDATRTTHRLDTPDSSTFSSKWSTAAWACEATKTRLPPAISARTRNAAVCVLPAPGAPLTKQ